MSKVLAGKFCTWMMEDESRDVRVPGASWEFMRVGVPDGENFMEDARFLVCTYACCMPCDVFAFLASIAWPCYGSW